jgi:hypothetical protein
MKGVSVIRSEALSATAAHPESETAWTRHQSPEDDVASVRPDARL